MINCPICCAKYENEQEYDKCPRCGTPLSNDPLKRYIPMAEGIRYWVPVLREMKKDIKSYHASLYFRANLDGQIVYRRKDIRPCDRYHRKPMEVLASWGESFKDWFCGIPSMILGIPHAVMLYMLHLLRILLVGCFFFFIFYYSASTQEGKWLAYEWFNFLGYSIPLLAFLDYKGCFHAVWDNLRLLCMRPKKRKKILEDRKKWKEDQKAKVQKLGVMTDRIREERKTSIEKLPEFNPMYWNNWDLNYLIKLFEKGKVYSWEQAYKELDGILNEVTDKEKKKNYALARKEARAYWL